MSTNTNTNGATQPQPTTSQTNSANSNRAQMTVEQIQHQKEQFLNWLTPKYLNPIKRNTSTAVTSELGERCLNVLMKNEAGDPRIKERIKNRKFCLHKNEKGETVLGIETEKETIVNVNGSPQKKKIKVVKEG